jgi:hypothetical protein
MATKVLQPEKPSTDPVIGDKPRLGDQNLMEMLKKTLASVQQTTDTKKAIPDNLGWRI